MNYIEKLNNELIYEYPELTGDELQRLGQQAINTATFEVDKLTRMSRKRGMVCIDEIVKNFNESTYPNKARLAYVLELRMGISMQLDE